MVHRGLPCPDPTSSSETGRALPGGGNRRPSGGRPRFRPAWSESGHADCDCRCPYWGRSARSKLHRFRHSVSPCRQHSDLRCSGEPPDRRKNDLRPSSAAEQNWIASTVGQATHSGNRRSRFGCDVRSANGSHRRAIVGDPLRCIPRMIRLPQRLLISRHLGPGICCHSGSHAPPPPDTYFVSWARCGGTKE